jgi:hypothetical protein
MGSVGYPLFFSGFFAFKLFTVDRLLFFDLDWTDCPLLKFGVWAALLSWQLLNSFRLHDPKYYPF